MKRQIRRGVFETNSSSTHSITMVSREEYKKWENGELVMSYDDSLVPMDQAIKQLIEDGALDKDFKLDEDELNEVLRENEYYTYSEYWDYRCSDYESFEDSYETKSGEEVVAFGYYGDN